MARLIWKRTKVATTVFSPGLVDSLVHFLVYSHRIKLEAQLTDKRNQRDATNTALCDKVKRVRNGIKANYGNDSSQYEMVGGTRATRTRKAIAA